MTASLVLVATIAASVGAISVQVGSSVPALNDPSVKLCREGECPGHRWEVMDGSGDYDASPIDERWLQESRERYGDDTFRFNSSGVSRDYGDGYSELILFGGYSSTPLCAKYKRDKPIDGHDKCPLERDWYQLWPMPQNMNEEQTTCWVDEIRAYQHGKALSNSPGSMVRIGKCPGNEEEKFKGYDFRYGGIRPQDNPDAALYPETAAYITEIVNRTGKKVVIKGCSGGTINSYAFLMSQTLEWRQKHVMAWITNSPVFGGTVSSIHSILSGWSSHSMPRCVGRAAAEFIPSVFWMWPPTTLWNKTEAVVVTPTKNYTSSDLDRMLHDMGLPKSQQLYDLEKADLLTAFPPPLIDTYVYYGFGLPTQAGFSLDREFSPETDGPDACPDGKDKSFRREWDDGDVTAPLRSVSRANAWVEAYKNAGVVLENRGYLHNSHACDCRVPECKTDYDCMLKKLKGEPHPGC